MVLLSSRGMLTTDSLGAAAKVAAANMLTFYNGDQPGGTPGIFDIAGWFWWMGGTGWNVSLSRTSSLMNSGLDALLVVDRRRSI